MQARASSRWTSAIRQIAGRSAKVALLGMSLSVSGCGDPPASPKTTSSPPQAKAEPSIVFWGDYWHESKDTIYDGSLRIAALTYKSGRAVTVRCFGANASAPRSIDIRYSIDVPLLEKLSSEFKNDDTLTLNVAVDDGVPEILQARSGFGGGGLWFLAQSNKALIDKIAKAQKKVIAVPTRHGEKIDEVIEFGVHGIQERLQPVLDACKDVKPSPRENEIQEFTAAIQREPNNPAGYHGRGLSRLVSGEFQLAIQDLSKVVELAPGNAEAYSACGKAYASTNINELAIKDYETAIRLNPTLWAAYLGRAKLFMDDGKTSEAIADFTKTIELKADSAQIYADRAEAYNSAENYDGALADFEKAISLEPAKAEYIIGRADAERTAGKYDDAIADYSKVIATDTNNAEALQSRALAHFYKGDMAAAAADFHSHANSGKDAYSMLFYAVAATKAGISSATDDLSALSAQLKDKNWPYSVIELFLGRQSADGVLAAARDKDQKCEAAFYVGEWQLLHNNLDSALTQLKAARDNCTKSFFESAGAVAELKRSSPSSTP